MCARRNNNRGVVLIFGLILLSVLAVVSATFALIVRQEQRAAVNALYGEQASLSARAGLAQGIRQIEAARDLYRIQGSLSSLLNERRKAVDPNAPEYRIELDGAPQPGFDWSIGPRGVRLSNLTLDSTNTIPNIRVFDESDLLLGPVERDIELLRLRAPNTPVPLVPPGNPGFWTGPLYLSGGGWHARLTVTGTGGRTVIEKNKWVHPYSNQVFGPGEILENQAAIRGRVFQLKLENTLEILQETLGEYIVAVVDLDGRVPVFPESRNFGNGSFNGETFLGNVLQFDANGVPAEGIAGSMAPTVLTAIQSNNVAFRLAAHNGTDSVLSTGEIGWRALVDVKDPTARNRIEELFTPYPLLLTTSGTRPGINVNTARRSVIDALLYESPGLDDTDRRTTVLNLIVHNRPFTGRAHFEMVLSQLAPDPVGDATLTELQFNDLLNHLNEEEPSIFNPGGNFLAETASAGLPGLYEFDFDPDFTATTPTLLNPPDPDSTLFQDAGETSVIPPENTTWATHVKFRSRYFHIYSVGRAVGIVNGKLQVSATRRVHAVYDADAKRILYYRNNQTDRANLADTAQ